MAPTLHKPNAYYANGYHHVKTVKNKGVGVFPGLLIYEIIEKILLFPAYSILVIQ
jgi:hypothetical protein